jgi:hypothetical protein
MRNISVPHRSQITASVDAFRCGVQDDAGGEGGAD